MIMKYCDLCKKQVEKFSEDKPTSGSLGELWAAAKVQEMCQPCFEKADKAHARAKKDSDRFFVKRMTELLKLDVPDKAIKESGSE